MKTYLTPDGSRIKAETAREFVQKMHESSRAPEDSDQAFMDQIAVRCHMQSGVEVRTNNAENFLADLIKMKFVEEV
jgi:hypothetical protein